jgi:hypothetical protein
MYIPPWKKIPLGGVNSPLRGAILTISSRRFGETRALIE